MNPVEITTGARLHFGLLCGPRQQPGNFGGLGMMIRHPGWQITAAETAAAADQIRVQQADPGNADEITTRVHHVLQTVRSRDVATARHLSIVVHSTIPFHCGFGAGTQLSLAVATAAAVISRRPRRDATAMSAVLGRSQRSAIGTFGFDQGGFLIDHGTSSADPRVRAVPVPESWRLVIARRTDRAGLHGTGETAVFDRQLQMTSADLQHLRHMIQDQIAPAVQRRDFHSFAEGLERYGRIVGEFFACAQGSCFSDPIMHDVARALHTRELPGPVQSSWGPAVAVPAQSPEHAQEIAAVVQSAAGGGAVDTQITEPLPSGATVKTTAPEQSSYRTLG